MLPQHQGGQSFYFAGIILQIRPADLIHTLRFGIVPLRRGQHLGRKTLLQFIFNKR